MRSWLLPAAVALSLLGCDSRTARDQAPFDKTASQHRTEPGEARAAAPATLPAPMSDMANGSDATLAEDQLPRHGAATETAAPSMIIRTGNASIEVDTLEPAIAQLRQAAARLGGYVANSSMQGGREQLRQATLELKIPAERFDELTAALQPLGKVEYVTIAAEDVGEEYTDVTARVANAHRLEERLVDLLASRTGKLQDVLAVERELARVRETIERYEGRLRYLKTRIAVSTLSVTLHEPPPLLTGNPGRSVIGDAFVRAWRNFVAVIAAFIASLGFLIPLGAVAAVAALWWRRYRHGQRPVDTAGR